MENNDYQEETIDDSDYEYEDGSVAYAVKIPTWLLPAAIGVLVGGIAVAVGTWLYGRMKK